MLKKTLFLCLIFSIIGCTTNVKDGTTTNNIKDSNTTQTEENKNPEWVNSLIKDFSEKPVQNPPASITQYDYKGQTVYYIPPTCCDQYSNLYDKDKNLICSPDGGITGKGDGKCIDFQSEKKNEKIIWNDTRK